MKIELEPLPYEPYVEWKKRRAMAWAKTLKPNERQKIRDFIATLQLVRTELKKERRENE